MVEREVLLRWWAMLGCAPLGAVASIGALTALVSGSMVAATALAGWTLLTGVFAFVAIRRVEVIDTARRRLAGIASAWTVFAAGSAVMLWSLVELTQPLGGRQLSDPVNAVFEAVSGVSTTGSSMLPDPSMAPPWLHVLRSTLQWVGCVGVVLFAIVAAEPSGDRDGLAADQWGDVVDDDVDEGRRSRRIAVVVTTVVLTLTVVGFVGLLLAGDRPWVALNHSMTAAATGGFTVTDDSVTGSTAAAQGVLAGVMVTSAMSFGTLYDTARRRGVPLWRRTQIRFAVAFTSICVALSVVVDREGSIWATVFESLSASTTAGFHIVDGPAPATLSTVAAIGIISMLIGGAAGSTGGGLKVARVAWLLKAVVRWTPGGTSVADEAPFAWDDDEVPAREGRRRVMGAAALATSWFGLLGIGTVALTLAHSAYPLGSAFYDAVSALSGVGLGSGQVDADLAAAPKLVLSVLMLAGRLEVTALVVLLLEPIRRLGFSD